MIIAYEKQPASRRYLLMPLDVEVEQAVVDMALRDYANWSQFVAGTPFEQGDVVSVALSAADQGRYTEKYARCLPENRQYVLMQMAKRALVELYKPEMRAKVEAMYRSSHQVA